MHNITHSFVQLKDSGIIKDWRCCDCKEVLTSNVESPVLVRDDSSVTFLMEFINKRIDSATRDITNNLLTVLCSEMVKLREDNKHLTQQIVSLKNIVLNQSAARSSHEAPVEVPSVNISKPVRRVTQKTVSVQKGEVNIPKNTDLPQSTKSIKTNRVTGIALESSDRFTRNVNKLSHTTAGKSVDGVSNEDNCGSFVTVTRKKRRHSTICGTAASDASFAAVVRRAWLFVGRAKMSVTVDDVGLYLRNKCPGYSFDVQNLTTNEKASTRSFRIGLDFHLLEDLNKPEFWPCNIVVRRYNFFRADGNAI